MKNFIFFECVPYPVYIVQFATIIKLHFLTFNHILLQNKILFRSYFFHKSFLFLYDTKYLFYVNTSHVQFNARMVIRGVFHIVACMSIILKLNDISTVTVFVSHRNQTYQREKLLLTFDIYGM